MSDRAQRRTQAYLLECEFLLPIKQFPALWLLNEIKPLITLVAELPQSSRHDICGFLSPQGLCMS